MLGLASQNAQASCHSRLLSAQAEKLGVCRPEPPQGLPWSLRFRGVEGRVPAHPQWTWIDGAHRLDIEVALANAGPHDLRARLGVHWSLRRLLSKAMWRRDIWSGPRTRSTAATTKARSSSSPLRPPSNTPNAWRRASV